MKSIWAAVLAAFFLCACSTLTGGSQPAVQPVYQLDLYGKLDGRDWNGIAVGSSAPIHDIQILSQTDVNYMTIQSCHRFEKYEDVIKTGWLYPNRGYDYSYVESPGIEDSGICILRLSAYSKQVGAGQAYGLIIFENKNYTATAYNICNGTDVKFYGTGVCQSEVGLVQQIKFKTQMLTANLPNGATIPKQCSGKWIDAVTWQYTMPLGECVSVFGSASPPYEYYIQLVYGFNTTQYRSNP